MSCDCYRLFPVFYTRFYSFYYDRSPEYRSVENSSYRSIRTFPHFLKIVFNNSCCIGRNSCTLYGYTIFLGSVSGIKCNLIISSISVLKSKIIVFRFELNKRQYQFIFDDLPEHSGHLIAIHFYERCYHLYLIHYLYFLQSVN